MNWMTFAAGVAAILYGLATGVLRIRAPEKFGKLAAMKAAWGERAGAAIHAIAYTVVPIAAGGGLIAAARNGTVLFGN